MPFDTAGFDVGVTRVLTPDEQVHLAALRKIRDGIERGEWCQGALRDGVAHCIVGWAQYAVQPLWSLDSHTRLLRRLYAELPHGAQVAPVEDSHPGILNTCLMNYNDARRRRGSQMIALVDRAISKLEHV